MRISTAAFAFLIFGALAAQAASETTFDCTVKKSAPGDWLPESLSIVLDKDETGAFVNDLYSQRFNEGRSAYARISVNNEKRTTFAWTLRNIKSRHGQFASRLDFRATIDKANGNLVISSEVAGYTNKFRGVGKCRAS